VSQRSVWAVVAGLLVVLVATTLVDLVLHATGVFRRDRPLDDALSLLATAYRVVIGVAGGWVAARLAPDRPMRHALILGAVGTVLGLVGLAATWNLALGPRWYPVALAVLALPQSWAGGKLHAMRAAAA
jgi:hypothetical protein